ncbi:MAG TPA: AAA family ATPase [Methanocella sp.]|nr:AAA family ATPase [Methanocella sp.]
MKVIAFVGMPGAGKTEASNVAREMGIPVVVMGDVIREEVGKRGLPPTDENIGAIANLLRKEEGMDAIARRCIPMIMALEGKAAVVVVDGIRGIAEVEGFKKAFDDNFTLVKIDAPFELRLERLKGRGRSDDVGSVEWLKRRDERELSWGMGKAMDEANESVTNLDPIQRFKDEIRSILVKESIVTSVSALVYPTELEEKVGHAVGEIFPGARLRLRKQKGYVDRLEGTAGLDRLHDLLRRQKILDTARSAMFKGFKNGEVSFELNKQAAYMGHVNFLDHEAALGGIYVTIRHGDPRRIIDWLAPETREGRPLEEIEL